MLNLGLWYRSFGPPADVLTLEAVKLPPLDTSLLRVRMTAAPINPSDLIPITGVYSHRVSPHRVAGYEGVGTVISGEGDAVSLIGKRVLPLRGHGTWQSYVDCDPTWVIPVPDDIDDAVAARGYINPLAAMLMLKSWKPAGKRILLTAAGSSCASLLAQWALADGATEVVGVYRSSAHRPLLLAQGIIPVGIDDVTEIAVQSSSADLVFDAVGGALATAILNAMRKDAAFITYGLLSGQAFAGSKDAPLPQRFHIRDRLERIGSATWGGWFQEIWSRLRRSVLPGITYVPLTDWRRALAMFELSGRQNKPVLDLR